MEFKTRPYNWQLNALDLSSKIPNMALLADVGTGKTFAMINILRAKYQAKPHLKTLIFAPSVVLTNWRDEIKKFSFTDELPDIKVLTGKDRPKDMCYLNNCPFPYIVITNYEAMDNEVFTQAVKKWLPDIIVCDELHKIKTHSAKRAKKIVDLGIKAQHRYGLTGTAVLNSPMDVFMQWKFLDQGASFGSNFFAFRAKYFEDKNPPWLKFPNWQPREHLFPELSHRIQSNSIRVKKEECLDLPPFIEETIELDMGKDQRKAYDQMKNDFITFIKDNDGKNRASVANIALTKALRMMQIASGHMTLDDGSVFEFEDNPKLEALEEYLEQITSAGHKVIVWCSYKNNYKQISELCKKMHLTNATLTGEIDAEEKGQEIYRFQNDPNCMVMVANRKAGGIGVNLTAASYSIVFSRNFSLEEEIQADGRNFRGGSEVHNKITKINLICRNSIDSIVMAAIQKKEDIAEKIIDLRYEAI
jgi:SNF2 family DNA or RNA helicase